MFVMYMILQISLYKSCDVLKICCVYWYILEHRLPAFDIYLASFIYICSLKHNIADYYIKFFLFSPSWLIRCLRRAVSEPMSSFQRHVCVGNRNTVTRFMSVWMHAVKFSSKIDGVKNPSITTIEGDKYLPKDFSIYFLESSHSIRFKETSAQH